MFKTQPPLRSQLTVSVALMALLAATQACSAGAQPTVTIPPSVVPTATENSSATQAARAAQATQTEAVIATQAAQTQLAHATAEAATLIAVTRSYNLTATPARATQVAANRQATRVAGTATAVANATQGAQSMSAQIQSLNTDGYLSNTDGTFHAIPSFLESWAQLGWYRFWDTEFSPKNFVLRADVAWQSGSDRADWWNSGCGFVFREESADNHYLIFLGLDGRVYLSGFKRGNFFRIGSAYYDKVDSMSGNANLMLLADGNKFTFFVNGTKVYSAIDNSFTEGAVALTLLSGTNKDFGTRCRMTNIELWELK